MSRLLATALASLIALTMLASLATAGTARNVARVAVELSELLTRKFGSDAAKLAEGLAKKHGDEAIADLTALAKTMPPGKLHVLESIASETPSSAWKMIARAAEQHPDFFEVVADPRAIRFLGRIPEVAEPVYFTLKAVPGRPTIELCELLAGWPEGRIFVGKLLPALGPDEVLQLHRILHGKTYSPDTLGKTISLANKYLGPRQVGDLTERAGTAAVNASRVPNLQIKRGTQLIDGKHNSVHGIDRIGLDPDGRPLIVEFTAGKNFKETGDPVQMTAEWVAERWNKLLADSAGAGALRDLGVPERFLKPGAVSPDVVRRAFVRKVAVPKETRISNFAMTGLDGTKDLVLF